MKLCGESMSEMWNALGISTPVIIVHRSWGGMVAGEFAIDTPLGSKAVVTLHTPLDKSKYLAPMAFP